MPTIRVASRRSQLAMTQTRWVMEQLRAAHPDINFEIVPVVTKGDRVQGVSLSQIGGKGLFVSEIEQTLLDGRADFAVHSLKDVPAELAPGLTLAAMPRREDPSDAWISRTGVGLHELPAGSRVGTSSLRRAAQLQELRPDLLIEPLRGNIDTRLRRLREGDVDAIVLAAAGLVRMRWEAEITLRLPPNTFIPAVGQGVLAVECREDDSPLLSLLRLIADAQTEAAATAERAFLARLGGSCQVPIGAFACPNGDGRWRMVGMVAAASGTPIMRGTAVDADPRRLGIRLAEELLARGAGPWLESGAAVHG
ncbi:hydroxymethylbilane synthase [Alicyclobacillus shizuokensis]|uniref:hydroxymethylbilane synthase n=1 Tax=Alicyclobacillus shizuokensis TaxID=392014 RepID=UPI00082C8A4A|nr:hydroxymethylbilane synthase [Alicyclobacillus shizuokensis]